MSRRLFGLLTGALLWWAVLGSVFAAEPAGRPVSALDPVLQGELQDLLSVCDQLIMQGSKDSVVYKSYQTVRNQMQAARIMFAADAKSSNTSLLKSAYFSPNRNGVSWVVVDPILLKTAKTQPGLALTLLMNAMVMADSFFGDPANFASLYQDMIGSFLFSMDALYIQAQFVRDFIKPHYPKISPYEQFLADSLEFENMASSAMFVLGVDQNIVYGLRALDADLKSKKMGVEAYFKVLGSMVSGIDKNLDRAKELNAVPENSGTADDSEVRNRTRYIAVISGLTLLKYGVDIMGKQLGNFDQATLKKNQGLLETFNDSLDAVAKKINPLADRVMDYRKNFLDHMGM